MTFIAPWNTSTLVGSAVLPPETAVEEEALSSDSAEPCSHECASSAYAEIVRVEDVPSCAAYSGKRASFPLNGSPSSPMIFSGLHLVGSAGGTLLDDILTNPTQFFVAVVALGILVTPIVFFASRHLLPRIFARRVEPPPHDVAPPKQAKPPARPVPLTLTLRVLHEGETSKRRRRSLAALDLPEIGRIPPEELTPASVRVLRQEDAELVDELEMANLLESLVAATRFEESSIDRPDADAIDKMAFDVCWKIGSILNNRKITIPLFIAESVLKQWIREEANRLVAQEMAGRSRQQR